MKLIGLTGGAGSGKSTVAEMMRDLGAAVVDADEATHAVYEPGTPGFELVAREFGPYYVSDGRIDRTRLGELVFRDRGALKRLNAIVHPLVREWMAQRTAAAADAGASVVVQDVPLIFENGLEGLYEGIVVVYVPREVQVRRLVDGRGLTEERARAIVALQMPIEEKKRKARYVVDNSADRDATRLQVDRIWSEIAG